MLYILAGLPGSGKSEIAKLIAEKTGAEILEEDRILRGLYPDPTHSDSERQRVYDEMFIQAKKLLRAKKDVILDATFISRANRRTARNLSGAYRIIEVAAPENEIKKRLKRRFGEQGNDADWEVYLKYKKKFEPISEPHAVIENSGSLASAGEKINRLVPNQ